MNERVSRVARVWRFTRRVWISGDATVQISQLADRQSGDYEPAYRLSMDNVRRHPEAPPGHHRLEEHRDAIVLVFERGAGGTDSISLLLGVHWVPSYTPVDVVVVADGRIVFGAGRRLRRAILRH